jgi:opacity protein-like surface antigen
LERVFYLVKFKEQISGLNKLEISKLIDSISHSIQKKYTFMTIKRTSTALSIRHIIVLTLTLSFGYSFGQGVSFSYLIPQNSSIAAPVSPFSIRGINLGNKIGLETGATLYSVPGLTLNGLPFEYDKSLIAHHFAILVPVQAFVKFSTKSIDIKPLFGGFAWLDINPQINEGNMDRAFRAYEGWQVLNSDFELDSKLGFGWMAGLAFEFKVSRKFSLTAEVEYLNGAAQSALAGTYSGGSTSIETKSIDIDDAEIDLKGLEISLGVNF